MAALPKAKPQTHCRVAASGPEPAACGALQLKGPGRLAYSTY